MGTPLDDERGGLVSSSTATGNTSSIPIAHTETLGGSKVYCIYVNRIERKFRDLSIEQGPEKFLYFIFVARRCLTYSFYCYYCCCCYTATTATATVTAVEAIPSRQPSRFDEGSSSSSGDVTVFTDAESAATGEAVGEGIPKEKTQELQVTTRTRYTSRQCADS